MRFEPGSTFAGYEIVSRLGRGGMATVYLVREPGLDRLVALKVLPGQLVDDQQFGARFEQEARVIGSLDHPHIIPVYRYGITDDVPWMALRYVDGGDFAARLIARPLALGEGFAILRGVASALDYAHRKGIVHRDIKPQNILLSGEGNSYLADFGVAKLLQSSNVSHTLIGGIVGSPAYMAPEQAQGHPLGPHTDNYSLGVICYQWLTGNLPFEADTPHAILLKHVLEPLPTDALNLLSPGVASALQRGMAKQPDDRFATASALISALEQAMYMPVSMGVNSMPALTPSGLQAISGVDRRLDTPTTLSRPVTAPQVPLSPAPAPSLMPLARDEQTAADSAARVTTPSPILTSADESARVAWRKPAALGAIGAALLLAAVLLWRALGTGDGSDSPGDQGVVQGEEDATLIVRPEPGPQPGGDTTMSNAERSTTMREALEAVAEPDAAPSSPVLAVPDVVAERTAAQRAELARIAAQRATDQAGADAARALRIEEERKLKELRAAQLAALAERDTPSPVPDATPRRNAREDRPPVTTPNAATPSVAVTTPAPSVVEPVVASSPSTQVPVPAPTTSIAQGARPPQRVVGGFIDEGGGILRDTRTGYAWTQADNGNSIDWSSAKSYCRQRGSGWRLPTEREAPRIIDRGGSSATRCGGSTCPVSSLFQLSGVTYWTSKEVGARLAYVAYLDNGKLESVSRDVGSPRALCVRKP